MRGKRFVVYWGTYIPFALKLYHHEKHQSHCARRDKRRHNHKLYKRSRIKIIFLKTERKRKDKKSGPSYKSDLRNNEEDFTDICFETDAPTVSLPGGNVTSIFCDNETTRLGYNAEITQLAVIAGQKTRSLHGNQVHAVSSEEVLNDFLSWVSDLPKPDVIVAHNGDKFVYPILYGHLQRASTFRDIYFSRVWFSWYTPVQKIYRNAKRTLYQKFTKSYAMGLLHHFTTL